jgi:hypothetical protein
MTRRGAAAAKGQRNMSRKEAQNRLRRRMPFSCGRNPELHVVVCNLSVVVVFNLAYQTCSYEHNKEEEEEEEEELCRPRLRNLPRAPPKKSGTFAFRLAMFS